MNVDIIESCSCAALCPCTLGPAKPDQEWCSGAFGMRITEGNSEGVDLSGATLALHFQLPGDFLGGMDKAKMYYDSSLSDAQRAELDAIFHGEKGGLWAGMKEAIKEWLPSMVTKVTVTDGNSPGAKIEGIGEIVLNPIKLEDGTPTKLVNAPILSAFGMLEEQLGFATGTKFSDPDMRAWESLGQGGTTQAVWAG